MKEQKDSETTYYVETKDFGMGEVNLFIDWIEHGDVVNVMELSEEYLCWDPWHNRLWRYLFGGHYKVLKRVNKT